MFIAWGYTTTGTFHRKPRETTSSMLEYLHSQIAYRQIGFHEVLEYCSQVPCYKQLHQLLLKWLCRILSIVNEYEALI